MLRFADAANLLTLAGLLLALGTALLAAHGKLALGLATLAGSGLCDLFDGLVARRMTRDDAGRAFGARLDSVVDACSFGLAPAVLLHFAGMRSLPEIAILGLFVCAAVWRLAWFDTVGIEGRGDARYYHGLPTTFVALIVPVGLLAGFAGAAALRVAASACALLLAVAMVSPIRVRKPAGAWYPILLAIALCVSAAYVAMRDGYPAR